MVIEQKFAAGQEPDPTEFLFISMVSNVSFLEILAEKMETLKLSDFF